MSIKNSLVSCCQMYMTDLYIAIPNPSQHPVQDMTVKTVKL